MKTRSEILSKLRELKPILTNDYSVKSIGLFGSYAAETATEHSDIDLLVELEKPIGWKFFSLEIYLEDVFGVPIDLVTKSALRPQMKDQILNSIKFA